MLFGVKGSYFKYTQKIILELQKRLLKMIKLIFFFQLLQTVLEHQKSLIKNERVFCLWMKVSISRHSHAF